MLLEIDMSTRELIRQMLLHNSLHNVLYCLAEEIKHCDPESFATQATRLFVPQLEEGIY